MATDDEIDSTPGLDQVSTTIQIRKWIAHDITAFRILLRERSETVRAALPADLVALAETMAPDGDPWARWLIAGICVRFTLRVVQAHLSPTDRLRPASVVVLPNLPTFATTEPTPKPKRGSR